MAYRAGLPLVLRGVSLQLAPGEKLGVCGRTGAGKSSLLVALFRLAELHAGAIRVDGVDISRVPLAALRARLAIIAQEPTLFTGTLRSNLDPLGQHADAALLAALEQCHLLPLALGHPSGLGRAIDERGANLSTGQRQLVCIARALLRQAKVGARGGSLHHARRHPPPRGGGSPNLHSRQPAGSPHPAPHLLRLTLAPVSGLYPPLDLGAPPPPVTPAPTPCPSAPPPAASPLPRALLQVLVLDEATAAVDLETDALIQATLRTRLGEASSLAIAHRLATLMHCDRVVVMSEGRAVEQGPPLELRDKAGSRFAELWAASAHS